MFFREVLQLELFGFTGEESEGVVLGEQGVISLAVDDLLAFVIRQFVFRDDVIEGLDVEQEMGELMEQGGPEGGVGRRSLNSPSAGVEGVLGFRHE